MNEKRRGASAGAGRGSEASSRRGCVRWRTSSKKKKKTASQKETERREAAAERVRDEIRGASKQTENKNTKGIAERQVINYL